MGNFPTVVPKTQLDEDQVRQFDAYLDFALPSRRRRQLLDDLNGLDRSTFRAPNYSPDSLPPMLPAFVPSQDEPTFRAPAPDMPVAGIPSREQLTTQLRPASDAGWQYTPAPQAPRPVPPPPPIWEAGRNVVDAIGTGHEWARQNVAGLAGAEDIAGQVAGPAFGTLSYAAAPQAEALYGSMIRGETPSFSRGPHGLDPLGESIIAGFGRLGSEAFEALQAGKEIAPTVLGRAGERWRETEMSEGIRMAAEAATPSNIAATFLPAEKVLGAGVGAVRALPGAVRKLPRIGLTVEDITKNPAWAAVNEQIEAKARALYAKGGGDAVQVRLAGHGPEARQQARESAYRVLFGPHANAERKAELVEELALYRAQDLQDATRPPITYPTGGKRPPEPLPSESLDEQQVEAALRDYYARNPGARGTNPPSWARGVLRDQPAGYGDEITPVGRVIEATGADPNKPYRMQVRVVDLGQLTASHSDTLAANPKFPAELQPRLRDRAASELQIDKIARELNPSALLSDTGTLDRGLPIIGGDDVVESGNGRILALRRALQLYPEKFDAYQKELAAKLPEYGIDPEAIKGMKAPVLVRERLTPVDRPAFAREANEAAVLQMSPYEQALADAKRISDAALGTLEVGESQSIDAALTSAANRQLARHFIGSLPENEAAALVDANGALNSLGLERLKAALFARTYQGETGRRLTRAFVESLDPTVKQIEHGLFASLPAMSRAEALIRAGYRDGALSIGEDVSKAVDMLARLRQNGTRVDDYLGQAAMFERELTPLQETLLAYFAAIGRSPRKVRELISDYARAVENAPDPNQMGMFGNIAPVSKEEILNGIIRRTAEEQEASAGPLFTAGRAVDEQAGRTAGEVRPAGAQTQEGTAAPDASQELARGVLNPNPSTTPAPSELEQRLVAIRSAATEAEVDQLVADAAGRYKPYDLSQVWVTAADRRIELQPLPPASPQPQAAPPATPAPAQRSTTQSPQSARPERVIPEPQQPRRPAPHYPPEPPGTTYTQPGLSEELDNAGIVPPRTAQERLPGDPGRVPPSAPPRTPIGPMRPVAPEPPPPDGVLPRFPSSAELEARTTPGGWVSKVGHGLARVPGVKGVVRIADPWAAQQSHVERIPLVFQQYQAMSGDIVKNAMAYLEAIPLKGVQIREGYFVRGVRPKEPGLSMATSDVLEHINRYDVTPELRQFVQTANALNDDLVKWAKAEGVKLRQMKFEPGGHYFGRLVREVRNIEKRGGVHPDQPRHYDSMLAGMEADVKYEDDLLATAEAGYSYLVRQIVRQRMGKLVGELGRTPKQLVDPQITGAAVNAAQNLRTVGNYERTLKAMRDGMAPTLQTRTPGAEAGQRLRAQLTAMDKIEPGTSDRVQQVYRAVENLPVGSPERTTAFRQLLEELKPLKATAAAEFRSAKAAHAQAMRGLQSAEFAEGARFGLPEGTIGLGRIEQGWAAGKLYPREVADYLNEKLWPTARQLTRAMDTVSSTSRTLVAGFDLGTTTIQLQGVMFSHPRVWGRTVGNMFAATAKPQVFRSYMARPENLAALKKLIPHGLSIEGTEYTEAATRGGILQRGAAKLGPKVGGAINRQVLERAEMAFQAPLMTGKIELAKALLPIAEREGRLTELATFLNNVTGTRSSLAAGIGQGQRSIESAFLFFSPRFTRSSIAIVADALQGGLKGREARRALASLMIGGTLVTAGLRQALGQPITPGFFDPSNPEFMTVELFGRRVGFGGPYRAMAVTLATSFKAAQQDPSLFLDVKDRRENPLVRWWTSRAAPASGLIWDAIEGRDFLGEPLDSTGAWARRGAKMVTPMAAQEFIPEPGKKPPEPASIIPDVLGLRAVPLSPAMERDRLRDQYAHQAYGQDWDSIDQAKRAKLEAAHPELVEAKQSATETYARRGSLLHEYNADRATAQKPYKDEMAALTEQLRAGGISGYDYRQAVGEREAALAQISRMLLNTAKYQSIPRKIEEFKEWGKRHGEDVPADTGPVDAFLDAYYGIADELRDPKTGELDAAKLVRAREQLKQEYPPEVVKEAEAYLSRNKDPELVQAEREFAQYMRIPRYVGLTDDQAADADKIAGFVAAYTKELGDSAKARALAINVFGQAKYGMYLLSTRKQFKNPERALFRKQHPLIDKYYSQQSTVDYRDLVPASAGR